MHLEQSRDDMSSLQCIHSIAVGFSFPRWEDRWTIDDLYDTDLSYKVFCNQDIKIQTFLDENRFPAAIQKDGHVVLMVTVGRKQKYPLCSNVNCAKSPKCIFYKRYKKILEEEENDDDSNYFWDRRSRRKASLIDNFLENLPIDEHHRKHVDYLFLHNHVHVQNISVLAWGHSKAI